MNVQADISSMEFWEQNRTLVKVKFEHEGKNYALPVDADTFAELEHTKGAVIREITL